MHDQSQFGEGAWLAQYWAEHEPTHRVLVDVGAAGAQISNTWGLLQAGWRGVLIDANPEIGDRMRREFARFDVQIYSGVAVSDRTAESDLYMHTILHHASLLPDWYPQTNSRRTVRVQERKLCDLLDESGIPQDFDLLSIDTEGMDSRILAHMFTFSTYRPRLIVTECTSYHDTDTWFGQAGYRFLLHFGNEEYGNRAYERIV